MAAFEWTAARETAAQLIAEGRLSDEEIAAVVGVDRRTLWNWRQVPEFSARVDETVDAVRATLRRRAISHAENRLARLNRDWFRLQDLIAARAGSPEMAAAPGGGTGLLVRTQKSLGSGPAAEIVDEFAFDAAVLKELREIEKQAAQELGQWAEKTDVTTNGQPVGVQIYLPANGRDGNPTQLPGPANIPGE